MSRTFPRYIPKVLTLTEAQKAKVPKGLDIKFGLNRAKQKNGTIYVTERAYYIDPETNSPRAIASVKIGFIPVGDTEIVYDEHKIKQTSAAAKPRSISSQVSDLAREMLSDNRRQDRVTFDMGSFWAVCLLASLTGKNSAVHIADYWQRENKKLRRLLPDLPDEPISHDTIRRLMTLLQFDEGMALANKLTEPMVGEIRGHNVNIDGQAVRASRNPTDRSMFMLNLYDSKAKMFLGHLMVDMKKNEYSEAKNLLKHFDISGTTVTADALFCKRPFVELILEKGADYCIPVKDNCKITKNAISDAFDSELNQARVISADVTLEHGRIEQREVRVLPGSAMPGKVLDRWPGLDEGCVAMSWSRLEEKKTGEPSTQARYFITSRRWDEENIEVVLANTIREHWSIENHLHRNLDLVFDQNRIQAKNADYVQARTLLNKVALNVLTEYRRLLGGGVSYSRIMERMRDAETGEKCLKKVCGTTFL